MFTLPSHPRSYVENINSGMYECFKMCAECMSETFYAFYV